MLESDRSENHDIEALKQLLVLHELRETQLSTDISKQKKLIAALRLAEERSAMLAAIVNSSDDAIISKDLNGMVTSWNKGAERIFGYSAAQMVGKTITKLIPEDRVEEEALILTKVRSGQRVNSFETIRQTSSGQMIDVSLTISPVTDFSGKIIGVSKIARDISAAKRAEQKGLILTAIVESTDDAIISKNLDGIITSWNASAERIFGYTADQIVGQSVLKLIPADRHAEEPKILERLRKGERLDHFQTKRVTREGRLIDVSLTISPLKDKTGTIIGVSKIARDITALVQAEQKGAILSAIVTNSDDAIISKDLNSIVTSWNNSAKRIFGYTAQEMIGESITKLIPADRQQEEPEIISKLKRGERVDHFETKRVTKQGAFIDVSLTISPVLNGRGEIIGVSKIARDITDKKLEDQRKNDFIAIVSHELKTPLTSIRSYVQLALAKAKERGDGTTETLMRRAENQTRKMTSMIHDFLNVSRLEEGKMSISLSRFSLPKLIEEVVLDFSTLTPTHHLEYAPGEKIYINGDREKLSHVLINLLGNAVKYSAEGTSIHIGCRLENAQATVNVTDQGVGITSADQKRLFERFYRVKDELVKNISGFGIGLYLVAEILKLHNSRIQVESEPGKGSNFFFSLPAD